MKLFRSVLFYLKRILWFIFGGFLFTSLRPQGTSESMASVSAGASSQGFQEPAAAHTTETMSSSSASPTEGGPPDLAETKDDEGRGVSGNGGDSAATVSREVNSGNMYHGLEALSIYIGFKTKTFYLERLLKIDLRRLEVRDLYIR